MVEDGWGERARGLYSFSWVSGFTGDGLAPLDQGVMPPPWARGLPAPGGPVALG